MREMDDNCLVKSDNIDTQRLHLKVNLRVVVTVYPPDRTISQLLHNKPNTDELIANLALAVMGLIPFAPLILQSSATRSSPNVRSSSGASSKKWPPSLSPPSHCSRRRPEATCSTFYCSPFLVNTIRHDADQGRKGYVLLRVLPGRI